MKIALVTLPIVAVALWAAGELRPPTDHSRFDLVAFGELPVLAEGRIKPIDTVARSGLLLIQGRQKVAIPGRAVVQPIEWLLDAAYRPDLADSFKVFRVDNAETLSLVGLSSDAIQSVRFSFDELKAGIPEIERQANLAQGTDASAQSAFQRSVVSLQERLQFYTRLRLSLYPEDSSNLVKELEDRKALRARISEFSTMDSFSLFSPIPPSSKRKEWLNIGRATMLDASADQPDPDILAFAQIGSAWRTGDFDSFNQLVHERRIALQDRLPSISRNCQMEVLLNRLDLFSLSIGLYVIAFVTAVVSWLSTGVLLRRISFDFLAAAFFIASVGILGRMWLEGRPPVTNLYSSALFIGWGAAGLCLVLEFFHGNGVACAAGGLLGVATLIIAHHLSLSGDTMQMMRAVLDSNFWLATHVITVTVGYSATFLAGFLALIYILRGVFTRSLDRETAKSLEKMVYGIVCFATLFSFVGTVLGGIWADQSWGRFWGWDPKENGALIIVVWNAVILHCRWGGLIGRRGLMAMAVVGNVVTAWSWFGTNMLGIGLHSYGFTSEAFYGLIAFVVSQLAIALIGTVPLPRWRSPLTT